MIRIQTNFALSRLITLAIAVALGTVWVSCMSTQQQTTDVKKGSAVAQTGPKLQPIPVVRPAAVRPRVPSQGDCAPRYANGGRGTCINNQPCRGFGVLGDGGMAICTCYGRDGGCGEGQRCDAMRLACVPEKEPVFGRGEVD